MNSYADECNASVIFTYTAVGIYIMYCDVILLSIKAARFAKDTSNSNSNIYAVHDFKDGNELDEINQ